jgi:hypothetical protein
VNLELVDEDSGAGAWDHGARPKPAPRRAQGTSAPPFSAAGLTHVNERTSARG